MNMLTRIVLAGGLLFASAAFPQQATEQYIPIGQSPGLSPDETVIGTITAVDEDRHRVTIRSDRGPVAVTMTEKTRYYLDSSHVGTRNYRGSYEDCEVGRRVEARTDAEGNVEWIKIESE